MSHGRLVVNISCALFIGLMALMPFSQADEITIAENGKTDYQIVLPDSSADEAIANCLENTAKVIKVAFKANNIEIPVTTEKDKNAEKSGIYLGATDFAKSNGIDVTKLKGWNYIQKAIGKNIIIAGNDQAPPSVPRKLLNRPFYYRMATLKATLDFLRVYCGTYVLYPGYNFIPSTFQKTIAVDEKKLLKNANIEYKNMSKITVPSGLDVHKKFFIDYNFRSTRDCTLYDIANNLFPRVDDAYFAHTYDAAVPPAKYREKHPEYFALIGGERTKTNHYCISNKGFQDTLYQWTKQWLDMGFKSVNILQQDGFRACQCENCLKLYGTGSDWDEKIWIFECKMAERIFKDYPDRGFHIVSYTLTNNPPKTFTKFPANVGIRVQGADLKQMNMWLDFEKKNGKIPQGFSSGIHNWIAHLATRYTPMRTPLFIEKQVKYFYENNFVSISRDGTGDVYGTEGPVYYMYGRMFDDPEKLTAKDLMFEYCDAAFGNSGAWMRQFYDTLYHAIESYSDYFGTHGNGWGYMDIYGRRRTVVGDPMRFMGFLYSPKILKEMNQYITLAENKKGLSEKQANRIALVRREFEYITELATVIHHYHSYEMTPDFSSRERLLNAIDKRNETIAGYYGTRSSGRWFTKNLFGFDQALFPPRGHSYKHLKLEYNRYHEPMKDTPFNWNTSEVRNSPLPGAKSIAAYMVDDELDINSSAWEKAKSYELDPLPLTSKVSATSSIKILYNKDNFYIRMESALPTAANDFEALGKDSELSKSESLDLYIAPVTGEEIFYRFKGGVNENSRYDAASGLIKDMLNLLYGKDDVNWNGDWQYTSIVDKDKKTWNTLVTIPFKTMSVATPQPGDFWRGNIGRIHIKENKNIEKSLWSVYGTTKELGDRKSFGEIKFEGMIGGKSASTKSRAQLWREKYYKDTFDIPEEWKKMKNLLTLPKEWSFKVDSLEKGLNEKWYDKDYNDTGWEKIPVPSFWSENNLNHQGFAWYRVNLDIPESWKGKSINICFGSADEEAWIYLNGKLILEHTSATRKLPIAVLWETPFIARAKPDSAVYGGKNVLAVRVGNKTANGGIWRPVVIYCEQ